MNAKRLHGCSLMFDCAQFKLISYAAVIFIGVARLRSSFLHLLLDIKLGYFSSGFSSASRKYVEAYSCLIAFTEIGKELSFLYFFI
jgi:hypothetical protein